jgi:hypothetical protein
MEGAVKAINKCRQVANAILGKTEGMVSAAETGLEITQDGVDKKDYYPSVVVGSKTG